MCIRDRGSTGPVTVGVDATKAAYTGGSGNDTVTISAAATKVIDGGAGAADELIVNATTLVANPTKLINFETLAMGNAATSTFDATGFAHLHAGLGISGGASFINVGAGTDLTVDAALTNTLTYTLLDASSATSDAVTIHVGKAATAADLNVGTVVTTGLEVVTIDSLGTGSKTNTISVTDAGALSLVVTGSEAATISGLAGATLTSINTSAATKLVDVTGVSVKATGVTVTAGAGGIKVNGGAGADIIVGGAGADTIGGGAGADTITGGGGADVITGGTGVDTITVSGVTSKVVQAIGDSGANTSTPLQTAELTSTFDVIKGLAAGDKIDLGVVAGFTQGFGAQTVNLTLAGTNLAGAANHVVFASGTYDAAAGIFSYAANGADTVLTYDDSTAGTGSSFESIILVGYHAGATTTAAAGVITLG